MRLSGVELRNFRSIGDKPVVLSPWRKCNILVGQNNSGKSNALEAIQWISDEFNGKPHALSELDCHRRSTDTPFLFRLYLECEDPQDNELAELVESQLIHFDFQWNHPSGSPVVTDLSLTEHLEDFSRANALLANLVREEFRDGLPLAGRQEVFRERRQGIWGNFQKSVPPAHAITEFRQIRSGDNYTFQGDGLVEMLRDWQVPSIGREQDQAKLERIQASLRKLLHMPDALLQVTTKGDPVIILECEGLRLPLVHYGTGVHELVILLTAALSVDNAICCIEEPEIHLHPRLQRELIDFLLAETTNQYLISTHSPTFVNAFEFSEDVQVFHLRLEDGTTVGGPIATDREALHALGDLGVKASDILQSNCVVWVEGPSDRVYLKRWFELVDPDLMEGREYAIMFYGGSLLAHLSAERDDIPSELIHLLRINQRAVVVMDSDRDRADAPLSPTKERIISECEASGGICWVTDGREIENYLPDRVVRAACEDKLGRQIELSVRPYDRFDGVLSQATKASGPKTLSYSKNKVGFAREFAGHFEDRDFSPQLVERLEEIVARIKAWNM